MLTKDQQNHNQGYRLRCATSILPGLVFGVTAITRTARSHYLRRLRLASWRHVAYIALCTATVSSLVGTAVGFKVKDESGARSGTVEVAFTEELGMASAWLQFEVIIQNSTALDSVRAQSVPLLSPLAGPSDLFYARFASVCRRATGQTHRAQLRPVSHDASCLCNERVSAVNLPAGRFPKLPRVCSRGGKPRCVSHKSVPPPFDHNGVITNKTDSTHSERHPSQEQKFEAVSQWLAPEFECLV